MTNSMQERFDEEFIKHRILHGGDKYPRLESLETSSEIKSFIQQEIDIAVAERDKEIVNIILQRTEIPKGARNPTRDTTVILGEELVDLITNKEQINSLEKKI